MKSPNKTPVVDSASMADDLKAMQSFYDNAHFPDEPDTLELLPDNSEDE